MARSQEGSEGKRNRQPKESSRRGVQRSRVVIGRISADADRTTIDAGGIELELLSSQSMPTAESIEADRAGTAPLFRDVIGKVGRVHGRQEGGVLLDARPIISQANPRLLDVFERIQQVIRQRGDELRSKPGVIALRPGYRFSNGWITDEPAIVAIVRRKQAPDALSDDEMLPAEIDGIPIDVAPATPLQQLMASSPTPLAYTQDLNDRIANPLGLAVPGSAPNNVSIAEDFTAEIVRKSKYIAPPNVSLDQVTGPMDVLCHASPDQGWPNLEKFLDNTGKKLTVAMYDFTAPHIANKIEAVLGRSKSLDLILDPAISLSAGGRGENPKANDSTEDDIVSGLRARLGNRRFAFSWAAVKRKGKTTAGIFPTAYHIKVAVQDSKAFWLSSGNWQSSNQPDLNPASNQADAELPGLRQTFNREWHVIVNHAGLARTYEDFIHWDMQQAADVQETQALVRPALDIPQEFEAQAATVADFFQPKLVSLGSDDVVQPLLTPDNYAGFALSVIKSARQSLRFQNQYINIAKSNPSEFEALLSALRDQIDAGLDVKIILRDIGDTRTMLESLKQFGIDPKHIRLQKACHNKGIIADDRMMIVGSHNWSGDGTCFNRDASLIFRHPDVVEYYTKIFDSDWDTLAAPQTRAETATPQLAVGVRAPEGTVRIPWDAYFGDDDAAEVGDALSSIAGPLSIRVNELQPPSITERPFEAFAPSSLVAAQPAVAYGTSSQLGDLRAAKAEASKRYLTSDRALAFSAQAATVSSVPESNVTAVGIGEKVSEGMPTGELAVKLFVRIKYTKGSIPVDHLLPTEIAGLPTDVEEVGEFAPLATSPNPRIQLMPAAPGCSIGFEFPPERPLTMAGTFGALVRDRAGNLSLLSNSHVLADSGRLPKGAPIYQVGLADLEPGASKRQIATLSNFSPFDDPTLRVDCALATPISPSAVTGDILGIGKPQGSADPRLDMIVHKFGRTTGYTAGRIVSVATDAAIDYEGVGPRTFVDQIMIQGLDGSTFSASGDSGALVLERQTNVAIGLLFAGSPSHTLANHLQDVLDALGVTLA